MDNVRWLGVKCAKDGVSVGRKLTRRGWMPHCVMNGPARNIARRKRFTGGVAGDDNTHMVARRGQLSRKFQQAPDAVAPVVRWRHQQH